VDFLKGGTGGRILEEEGEEDRGGGDVREEGIEEVGAAESLWMMKLLSYSSVSGKGGGKVKTPFITGKVDISTSGGGGKTMEPGVW